MFDPFSWAGSDLSQPVIIWTVSSVEALTGGTRVQILHKNTALDTTVIVIILVNLYSGESDSETGILCYLCLFKGKHYYFL